MLLKQVSALLLKDRKSEGLILDFSIKRNIALPSVDTFAKNSVINYEKLSDFANTMAERLGVKKHIP